MIVCVASTADDHVRICAEERILRDSFSAFHRFEEKRIAARAGNIHKRVDRIRSPASDGRDTATTLPRLVSCSNSAKVAG